MLIKIRDVPKGAVCPCYCRGNKAIMKLLTELAWAMSAPDATVAYGCRTHEILCCYDGS